MDEVRVGMVMGSAVLVIAAIFVVGHYRREHRRAQLLWRPDLSGWPWRQRRE
ncbi:hypothetical protein [Paraburkholderia dilworthii]|uniref:hypothetical protein n=1 Tax=Paraburkholderia dilworthii TaxID=948106 RepID=UPI001427BFC4|nr:hypothetical protein [Paraburkholderia dilworthii]